MRAPQAKANVGPTDDPLERNADNVADRVVQRMERTTEDPEPIDRRKPVGSANECEECAHDDTVRRRTAAPATIRDAGLQTKPQTARPGDMNARQAVGAVAAGGKRLPPAQRAPFERHFGHDFARVRIYDDAASAAAAKALDARAYTIGEKIAFAPGEYAPHTRSGKHLLAHELTHVAQQSARSTIRRASPKPTAVPATMPTPSPTDFQITESNRSTSDRVFFDRGSAVLKPDAQSALADLKYESPASVALVGFVSMDESGSLAAGRAAAVENELKSTPDPVTVSKATGNPGAMASNLDFAEARSVEIVRAGGVTTTPDCEAKDSKGKLKNPPIAPCTEMDKPTWTAFQSAWPVAKAAMKDAHDAVKAAATGADTQLIDTFFGDHSATTLADLGKNVGRLEAHVNRLDKITKCGGPCDHGRCDQGTIAYNKDTDSAAKMTLCVPVFKGLHPNDQARNLIHESAHGTTPLGGPVEPTRGTRDVAYRHERMMFQLAPADRLRNSDSYALFALFAHEIRQTGKTDAVPKGISTPQTDALNPGFAANTPKLARAVAHLEKRLGWANSKTSGLFGQMGEVRSGKSWADSWAESLMTQTARLFPVTSPPATPTQTDHVRVAGIRDRYARMRRASRRRLTIEPMTTGIVAWPGSTAATAGSKLKVGPDFFTAAAEDQTALLLENLAKATRGVEPAFVPAYVSLAKWIHDQNR